MKALYRRAQAQLALGYFIEAQQDVKAVLLHVRLDEPPLCTVAMLSDCKPAAA